MVNSTLQQDQITARELLRGSEPNIKAADAAVVQARELAAKAAARVEKAEQVVASFGDLDAAILEHHVNSLKNGTDAAPSRELRDRRQERLYATEELDYAKQAQKVLDEDVLKLEREAGEARTAQHRAAFAAFKDELVKHIAHLEEINQERKRLQIFLRGASCRYGNHAEIDTMIRPAVLDENQVYLPMSGGPLHKVKDQWTGFGNELLTNADADLGEPPTWDELWS